MSKDGITIQEIMDRLTRLESTVLGSPGKIIADKTSEKKFTEFSMNERAYAQKYCRTVSGPKKFTLLVAFLARGQENSDIAYKEISELWKRMTVIIGKFNAAYSDGAKRSSWVTTHKKGFYQLTGTWKEAIG